MLNEITKPSAAEIKTLRDGAALASKHVDQLAEATRGRKQVGVFCQGYLLTLLGAISAQFTPQDAITLFQRQLDFAIDQLRKHIH